MMPDETCALCGQLHSANIHAVGFYHDDTHVFSTCAHAHRIPYTSSPNLHAWGHSAFKSKCAECGKLLPDEPNQP